MIDYLVINSIGEVVTFMWFTCWFTRKQDRFNNKLIISLQH